MSLALCQQTWRCEIGNHGSVYTVMNHGHGYSYTRCALLSMHTVIQNGIVATECAKKLLLELSQNIIDMHVIKQR